MPLGSLLASLLDPLGRPNRPKFGLKRLLNAYLVRKRRFSKKRAPLQREHALALQDGTQDDPKSTQDGSKTIFQAFFFRLRF